MALGDALRDIGDAIGQAVSDIGGALGLGGGRARGTREDQADRVGRTRPQARPSIMSRGDQLVATRDIPRHGITAGQVFDTPDYGMYSARGIMSTDPAQIARVTQARERAEAQEARATSMGSGEGADRAAEARKGARAAEPETPAVPAGEAKGGRPGAEGTGESAAARARRLGLASTIATTPGGLLADSDATRRRRSLIGGGLIQ